MNFGTKCRYSFGNSDVIMNKMKTMKVMQIMQDEELMENKKLNQEDKKAAQEVTEISLEDLEQVAGGYSLREKKKVETTAISDDTISRI